MCCNGQAAIVRAQQQRPPSDPRVMLVRVREPLPPFNRHGSRYYKGRVTGQRYGRYAWSQRLKIWREDFDPEAFEELDMSNHAGWRLVVPCDGCGGGDDHVSVPLSEAGPMLLVELKTRYIFDATANKMVPDGDGVVVVGAVTGHQNGFREWGDRFFIYTADFADDQFRKVEE